MVYELQNALARLGIVIAVTLQYLLVLNRIFQRNERNVRRGNIADKENKRFFSHEFLVVTHTPDAVVQIIAFVYQFFRAFCYEHRKPRIGTVL